MDLGDARHGGGVPLAGHVAAGAGRDVGVLAVLANCGLVAAGCVVCVVFVAHRFCCQFRACRFVGAKV